MSVILMTDRGVKLTLGSNRPLTLVVPSWNQWRMLSRHHPEPSPGQFHAPPIRWDILPG